MWGRLFAHIVTATGWTLPVVRRLTLWDVADLSDYWKAHPPAHLALAGLQGALGAAAALGGGGRPAPAELRDPSDPHGIGALAAALGVEVPHGP